ncbi:hypothetical protein LCGC14_1647680 [marine sediment metagenome]|uniref:Uncharacterized protein n=1 Tax=marine sediment metagenome TaxID=412755 RepID=A0A0F9HXQ4_9ZZZZ
MGYNLETDQFKIIGEAIENYLLKLILFVEQRDKDSPLPIGFKDAAKYKKLFKNLIDSIESINGIYEFKDQITLIEETYHKVDRVIADAKENYSIFLVNGKITNGLLESTLLLVQVDKNNKEFTDETRVL